MTQHNPSQRPMFTTLLSNWLFFNLFFLYIFHILRISTYKISHLWCQKKIHVNRLTFVHKKNYTSLPTRTLRLPPKIPIQCANNEQLLISQPHSVASNLQSRSTHFFLYRAHRLFDMISSLNIHGHALRWLGSVQGCTDSDSNEPFPVKALLSIYVLPTTSSTSI